MKTFNPKAYKDRLRGHKDAVISLYSPSGSEGHMLYSISREGAARGWDLAKRQITIKCSLSRQPKQQGASEQDKGSDQKNDAAKDQRRVSEQNDEQNDLKQQKGQNEQQDQRDAKDAKGQKNNKQQSQQKVAARPREQILSACFTEKFVFASYEEGGVAQYEFTNQGLLVREFLGHTKRVNSMFAISGQLLVTGSYDSTIRTWNIGTGDPEAVYKTAGPVNSLMPGSGHQILAVVNRNTFYQIDTKKNSVVHCIKFGKHSITSFFCQDDVLMFGNIDNKVLVYHLDQFDPQNPTTFEPKKIIDGLGGWILQLKPHNGLVYAGCDDKKIRVYSWPDVRQVEELPGHDDGIISIDFASKMMFSGSYDHSIRSWDIEEMLQRINERNCMQAEDVDSKKYEVYYGVVFKNRKKKLPAKKKEKKEKPVDK